MAITWEGLVWFQKYFLPSLDLTTSRPSLVLCFHRVFVVCACILIAFRRHFRTGFLIFHRESRIAGNLSPLFPVKQCPTNRGFAIHGISKEHSPWVGWIYRFWLTFPHVNEWGLFSDLLFFYLKIYPPFSSEEPLIHSAPTSPFVMLRH